MPKTKLATVNRDVACNLFSADTPAFLKGEVVVVLKEYFFNGEGWVKVRDGAGNVSHVPAVFFDLK